MLTPVSHFRVCTYVCAHAFYVHQCCNSASHHTTVVEVQRTVSLLPLTGQWMQLQSDACPSHLQYTCKINLTQAVLQCPSLRRADDSGKTPAASSLTNATLEHSRAHTHRHTHTYAHKHRHPRFPAEKVVNDWITQIFSPSSPNQMTLVLFA